MKKRDLFVVFAILLLAVVLLIYGLSMRTSKTVQLEHSAEAGMTSPSEDPFSEAEAGKNVFDNYSEKAREAARAYMEEYPAEAYLLVTTNNGVYSPIPLNGENAFRIKPFYMESSNCDNQNCVGEGEVTLENRKSRILFNMVICLPHQLSLELLTPSETEERMLELYAGQEAYQASHPEISASAVPADGGKDENG